MNQERQTYRAKHSGICFCGREIRSGQPIQYVPTAEVPKTGARWQRQVGRTQAAHEWCARNLLVAS